MAYLAPLGSDGGSHTGSPQRLDLVVQPVPLKDRDLLVQGEVEEEMHTLLAGDRVGGAVSGERVRI